LILVNMSWNTHVPNQMRKSPENVERNGAPDVQSRDIQHGLDRCVIAGIGGRRGSIRNTSEADRALGEELNQPLVQFELVFVSIMLVVDNPVFAGEILPGLFERIRAIVIRIEEQGALRNLLQQIGAGEGSNLL
jgi:hypothetical protein